MAQYPQIQPLELSNVVGPIYRAAGGTVANTGFYIGPDAILAVDSKMTTEASAEMLKQLRNISTNPITHLIITHSDLDHVNGLAGFPRGMKIIAQENTKREMAKAFADPALLALKAYLPNQTYTDQLDLDFAGTKVLLYHFAPAHTSGDTVVFFPAERTAFVGDLVFIGRDPLVHRPKMGTAAGLLYSLKALLSLEADRFISGHSPVVSKKEIAALLNSLESKQQKVAALVRQGKTLAEVKTELQIEEPPVTPGRPRFTPLVEVMFLELTEKSLLKSKQ